MLAWAGLFTLGPVGSAIVGRSAGVRGALSWTWLIVTLSLFVEIWFVVVARFSGALGNSL